MYEAILEGGVSDSKAARLARVSTSAVSRWKAEIPIFAEFLLTARAKFEFAQIKQFATQSAAIPATKSETPSGYSKTPIPRCGAAAESPPSSNPAAAAAPRVAPRRRFAE
jgi:hypothetical protein